MISFRCKKVIYILCFILTGILMFTGCETQERKKLKESYSEKKVEKMVKQYIANKYGEQPSTIKEIIPYEEVCGGIDATVWTGFAGYAISVDDYMVYLCFDKDKKAYFVDDRQSQEIEKALREVLNKIYDGKCYLSTSYPKYQYTDEENEGLPYVNDARNNYSGYFNGDLKQLFTTDKNNHYIDIYVDAEETDSQTAKHIIKEMEDLVSVGVTVWRVRADQYEALKPDFDDYDKMQELKWMDEYVEECIFE